MEHRLTDQQLLFMRVLWRLEEASVADVHVQLAEGGHRLAPTSVATVLGRLEKKGLVKHRAEGRQYVYRALVSEGDVRTSVLSRVTRTLFGGDATALVSQLLDQGAVSSEDLREVQKMLRDREKAEDQ